MQKDPPGTPARHPLDALADVDCTHPARYRVTCLVCAADAVRPAINQLRTRLRDAYTERDTAWAYLAEFLAAVGPDLDEELRGRARRVLEAEPASEGGAFLTVDGEQDWETAAHVAMRRVREGDDELADLQTRLLTYAERALTASDAAHRTVEVLAGELREEVLPCPYGHGRPPPPDCVWCCRNTALNTAIGIVEGRYRGPDGRARRLAELNGEPTLDSEP